MEFIEHQGITDSLWLIVSAALVFLILIGFLAREAGLTRGKNSANVASKSFGGISITILTFWLIGFGLMFGASGWGLGYYGASAFGLDFASAQGGNGQLTSGSDINLARSGSFFLFQALLCATAFMIMIGAAAERLRFESAVFISILFSGLIYPIVGHWSWAGQTDGAILGWLNGQGFVDFGGSSVIHSVAGWSALALLILLKPRIGRFTAQGKVVNLPKADPALVAIGTLLIWLGWFGLAGGQAIRFSGVADIIFVNLLIAGAVGAVAVIPTSMMFRRGHVEFELLLNGALAGLVAVTAGIHAYGPRQVIVVAIIGAWLMLLVRGLLLRSRIDDVTSTVPVHLAAGIWGTIAVALFGAPEILNTGLSSSAQLTSQLIGVLTIGGWSFIVSLISLNALNLIFSLRISEEEELLGLNITEQREMPDYSEYPGLGELLGQ